MTHRFWGVSLPAGGSITQKLERGSTLVLTAVGVSGGASAERTVLRAESSGCDAVLCSLWSACTSARFAQPFNDDVTFRSTGGAELHLSGFARGALSEPEASGKKAKAKKPAAVADLVGLAPPSVEAALGKKKAKASAEPPEPAAAKRKRVEEPPAKAPAPAPAPAKPAPAKPDASGFLAAKKFDGAKKGMVFRKGPKGLGYYIDTPPKPSAAVAALARGGGAASGGGAPATQKTKSGLELKDVRAGRGNAAKSGDRVSVKYRGTLTNGKQFDAGSIDFRLGRGEVIRGCTPRAAAASSLCVPRRPARPVPKLTSLASGRGRSC